jgi:large subunit ribosomal protein L21
MAYAVIKTGGKQYRVEEGTTLLVERLSGDEGSKLELEPLLYADGDKTVFGPSDLGKVKVEAKVVGHERGPKLRVFKYRPKKGYRKRAGHRSELTRLEITDVKMLSRKPAARTKSSATKTADGSATKKEQSDGS